MSTTTTTNVQRRNSIGNSIKSCHEDLNTAYQTYYAPDFSRRASMDSTPGAVTSHPSPLTNLSKAWKALNKFHEDLNTTYEVSYAPSRSSSTAETSPAKSRSKHSIESLMHDEENRRPRNYERLWKWVKNAAIKHHKGAQAECDNIYGTGRARELTNERLNPCKALPAGI